MMTMPTEVTKMAKVKLRNRNTGVTIEVDEKVAKKYEGSSTWIKIEDVKTPKQPTLIDGNAG